MEHLSVWMHDAADGVRVRFDEHAMKILPGGEWQRRTSRWVSRLGSGGTRSYLSGGDTLREGTGEEEQGMRFRWEAMIRGSRGKGEEGMEAGSVAALAGVGAQSTRAGERWAGRTVDGVAGRGEHCMGPWCT